MAGTAVVTGASSGIGLATVRALAEHGWRVVATARTLETATDLQALGAGAVGDVECRELDVTDASSVQGCIGGVLADRGSVELLVNNAGMGYRGTLEQLDIEDLDRAMQVNFFGVARVTKAVLPSMRTSRAGRIVTVTSMNGLVGLPFSDAYNASKFAVEGLMEGLAPVLQTFGIHVSLVEPGPVRTSFRRNTAGRVGAPDPRDPYADLMARAAGRVGEMLDQGEDPADVAALIAHIADHPAPSLRYQSSDAARANAARKVVDVTGDSVVAALSGLIAP